MLCIKTIGIDYKIAKLVHSFKKKVDTDRFRSFKKLWIELVKEEPVS
jgi:hypothetical protein